MDQVTRVREVGRLDPDREPIMDRTKEFEGGLLTVLFPIQAGETGRRAQLP